MHKIKKFDGPKFRREFDMARYADAITYVKTGAFNETFTTEYNMNDVDTTDDVFTIGRRSFIEKRAMLMSAIYYLTLCKSNKVSAFAPLCKYLAELFPNIEFETMNEISANIIIDAGDNVLQMYGIGDIASIGDAASIDDTASIDDAASVDVSVHYAPWDDRYMYAWGPRNIRPHINYGAVKHHSNTTREFGWYTHDITLPEHLRNKHLVVCNCYDCTFEIHVWRAYLKYGPNNKLIENYADMFDLTNSQNDHVIALMMYLPWSTNYPPHSSQSIRTQCEKLINFYPFSIIEVNMIANGLQLGNFAEIINKSLHGEIWTTAERKFIDSVIKTQYDLYATPPFNARGAEFKLELLHEIKAELDYHVPEKRLLHRIHIGQRKLLLNEIIFLTDHGHLSDTVVYAGAAAGIHIPLLSKLFPQHKLILWDPARFAIRPTDKIEIHNDFFTHDVAKKYNKVLFISDIRSGSEKHSFEEFEQEVITNNDWQRDWVRIMQSPMSMLKFRVPFTTKSTYKYLSGDIYMQPWAPVDSAETRLITNGNDEVEYDAHEYENRTFYLNNVTREFTHFAHDIPTTRVHGLCHCYDCAYEIWIWRHYFTSFAKMTDQVQINEAIIDIMNQASSIIGRSLFGGIHGLYANLPMLYKRPLLRNIAAKIK